MEWFKKALAIMLLIIIGLIVFGIVAIVIGTVVAIGPGLCGLLILCGILSLFERRR